MESFYSNSFITEPITTADTHYYYYNMQHMDMNNIATDPIKVRASEPITSEGYRMDKD